MLKRIRNNLFICDFDKHKLLEQVLAGQKLCFSLSDSGAFGACVVSNSRVGVDIQKECERARILRKFYTKNERELPFAKVWARKEAYAKWLGTGLNREVLAIETCDLAFEEYEIVEGGVKYYLAVYPRG